MRISTKLKLNSLVVLTLLVLNAAVAIFLIQRMAEDARQLVDVHVLTAAETERVVKDARRSGEIAITVMLVAGLLIFTIVGGVGLLVSRGIVDATNRLSTAAAEFGRGNFDHRIEAGTEDELGALAVAFNEMADRRKQAEARATRFDRVLENSLNEIYTFDAKTLHFIEVNRGARENLGYSSEELHDLTPIDLKPRFTAESFAELVEPLREGVDRKIQFTTVHRRKDGTEYPVEVHLQLMADGDPVFVAIILDITERMRAENALRQSEEDLRIILDSIGDGVIATDTQGNITRMNPVAESLTGWTSDESRDKPLAEVFNIVNAQTNQPAVNPVTRVVESGTIVGLANDTILIAKDGTERQIADSAAPVMGKDGKTEGVVLVFRDVTVEYQRQAQLRQQQKLESIGLLAGGVAHEINNPINGIMNFAQLIDERLDPASPLREFAAGIGQETKRVAEIVRNLLAFARQEKESHSPANIADIVNNTLSLIRTIIRRDQITLEVDVPDDLPKIKCRSQQIQQVLMNLLTNARDALNTRYPEYDDNKVIAVRVRAFEQDGRHWIRATVEDRGVGIREEIRDRLFDPFFTTKDRAKGTGLGLSISHGIVQDHHGRLRVESEPGEPMRFHLELPVDNGWELGEVSGSRPTEKEIE